MALNVGIDFGTSNSGVAVSDGDQVHLLPIDQYNVIPQVVKTILYITRDQKISIGQAAVEQYYKHNVSRQRRFVKQWAGELEFTGAEMFYVRDVFVYVDELKPGRLLQFIKTALRSDTFHGTQIFDRYYSLEDLISVYLRQLKQRAEALLHDEIKGVTLGRPVKFSTNSEQDKKAEDILRQAAMEAGFRQVSMELEPVAAAVFYEQSLERPQNTLIFDFGGGTLDLTIMRLGEPKKRKVFASGGIDIAGSDFDRAIIEKRLLPHFGKEQVTGPPELLELINSVSDWTVLPDLSTPRAKNLLEKAILQGKAPARLKTLEALIFNDLAFSFYNTVEKAKVDLSSEGAVVISLQDEAIDLWELYTRFQFEKDIQEYRNKIEGVLMDTIAASGFEPEEIEAVVTTGGSSRIPIFLEMLDDLFGHERVIASDTFNSVTAGLGIRAQQSGN